jgi:hypothetical protein
MWTCGQVRVRLFGLSARMRREIELKGHSVGAMSASGRRLHSLIIIMALTGGLARAQDLDRDKSGAKLFATNCVDCHHSPSGLAQDRVNWTLSYFLQQHYTSTPASAQALTAYLQSIDARRPKPQPAVQNGRAPENNGSASPLRPPARVPVR